MTYLPPARPALDALHALRAAQAWDKRVAQEIEMFDIGPNHDRVLITTPRPDPDVILVRHHVRSLLAPRWWQLRRRRRNHRLLELLDQPCPTTGEIIRRIEHDIEHAFLYGTPPKD